MQKLPSSSALHKDTAIWSLVLANTVTIAMALVFSWPTSTLLLPYWLQSGVIGYYSQKRIRMLRDFVDFDGTQINGELGSSAAEIKRSAANLLIAFYFGLFHLGTLAALVSRGVSELAWYDWIGVVVATVSFIANHRTSFQRNVQADTSGRPKLSVLILLPFVRVVPMQLIIMVGVVVNFKGGFVLVLFGVAKTAADIVMHNVEHRTLQMAGR